MSATEASKSLLGHDNEQAAERWKQEAEEVKVRKHHRWYLCFSVFTVTILLIPLATLFILYLRWQSSFQVPAPIQTTPPELDAATGPQRDLKFLLHPESHVSRDPGIRHFLWNITKARIAPNGVYKDVFLINGMSYSYYV